MTDNLLLGDLTKGWETVPTEPVYVTEPYYTEMVKGEWFQDKLAVGPIDVVPDQNYDLPSAPNEGTDLAIPMDDFSMLDVKTATKKAVGKGPNYCNHCGVNHHKTTKCPWFQKQKGTNSQPTLIPPNSKDTSENVETVNQAKPGYETPVFKEPTPADLQKLGWNPAGKGFTMLKHLATSGETGMSISELLETMPKPPSSSKPDVALAEKLLADAMKFGIVAKIPAKVPGQNDRYITGGFIKSKVDQELSNIAKNLLSSVKGGTVFSVADLEGNYGPYLQELVDGGKIAPFKGTFREVPPVPEGVDVVDPSLLASPDALSKFWESLTGSKPSPEVVNSSTTILQANLYNEIAKGLGVLTDSDITNLSDLQPLLDKGLVFKDFQNHLFAVKPQAKLNTNIADKPDGLPQPSTKNPDGTVELSPDLKQPINSWSLKSLAGTHTTGIELNHLLTTASITPGQTLDITDSPYQTGIAFLVKKQLATLEGSNLVVNWPAVQNIDLSPVGIECPHCHIKHRPKTVCPFTGQLMVKGLEQLNSLPENARKALKSILINSGTAYYGKHTFQPEIQNTVDKLLAEGILQLVKTPTGQTVRFPSGFKWPTPQSIDLKTVSPVVQQLLSFIKANPAKATLSGLQPTVQSELDGLLATGQVVENNGKLSLSPTTELPDNWQTVKTTQSSFVPFGGPPPPLVIKQPQVSVAPVVPTPAESNSPTSDPTSSISTASKVSIANTPKAINPLDAAKTMGVSSNTLGYAVLQNLLEPKTIGELHELVKKLGYAQKPSSFISNAVAKGVVTEAGNGKYVLAGHAVKPLTAEAAAKILGISVPAPKQQPNLGFFILQSLAADTGMETLEQGLKNIGFKTSPKSFIEKALKAGVVVKTPTGFVLASHKVGMSVLPSLPGQVSAPKPIFKVQPPASGAEEVRKKYAADHPIQWMSEEHARRFDQLHQYFGDCLASLPAATPISEIAAKAASHMGLMNSVGLFSITMDWKDSSVSKGATVLHETLDQLGISRAPKSPKQPSLEPFDSFASDDYQYAVPGSASYTLLAERGVYAVRDMGLDPSAYIVCEYEVLFNKKDPNAPSVFPVVNPPMGISWKNSTDVAAYYGVEESDVSMVQTPEGKKYWVKGPSRADLVLTSYALTQSVYKKAGVSNLHLYRGIYDTGHDPIVKKMEAAEKAYGSCKIEMNPASSWTSLYSKGKDFAKGGGIVFEKEDMPVHQVFIDHNLRIPQNLLTKFQGQGASQDPLGAKPFGSYNEQEKEFVVIGFESKPKEKLSRVNHSKSTKIAIDLNQKQVSSLIQPNKLLPNGYGEYVMANDEEVYWRTNQTCVPIFFIDSSAKAMQ